MTFDPNGLASRHAQAMAEGDEEQARLLREDYFSERARLAKQSEDNILLYLLVLRENCISKDMHGAASMFTGLALAHDNAHLDVIGGVISEVVILEYLKEVRLVG